MASVSNGCWLRSGAALATLLVACSAEQPPASAPGVLSGRLTLTGSSTVAPLALEMGRRFEELHPAVRVDVQTGGSSRGIRDAREGTADIGMASRPLTPDERVGLVAHTLARDTIALIVHADNPITAIGRDQVRAIYRGEIDDWSEVGGRRAPITVVNKAAGRATLDVFARAFELGESEIRADVVIGENEQGVKTVAGNPDAIGYVSLGTASYHVDAGVPIKTLSAEIGVPMSRPLNLVTRPEVGALARAFIDYCQSQAVHDLVRELYFAPAGTSA